MKKTKILFWTTTIFLLLFEGVMPISTLLFAPEYALVGVNALEYPDYFGYALIAFKAIGSILLMLPNLPRPLKEWTYAGFGFNFAYASISHFVIDGFTFVSFFPLIFIAILAVSYSNYFKLYQQS